MTLIRQTNDLKVSRAAGIEYTGSLCPECLRYITARRIFREGEAFLEKTCPDHGLFQVPVWRGPPDYEAWSRPKEPARPKGNVTEVRQGCPFDCGLCPDHRQHTCTALLEVTSRCNLYCPVCYADTRPDNTPDPGLSDIAQWYRSIRRTAGPCNIQLSGGEPTVRDDLPDIVARGRDQGFSFIQVNTNGLRLAEEKDYLHALKRAGLSSVFLQFDGLTDNVYRAVRGRDLADVKMSAIERCADEGLGVVLVPTLVKGVNTHQIGDIIRLGLKWSPTVRGVHFQPISYFGRYPCGPGDRDRLTLPEIMRAIEDQTGGLIKTEQFGPPGCENAYCSFHGNFILLPSGELKALSRRSGRNCCPIPEKAEEGARRARDFVSRQWLAPHIEPGPDPEVKCTQAPQAGLEYGPKGPISLDGFLTRARQFTFSVSAMAFQDAWSVDLDRLRECCIHVATPDGKLIPFCAYNLTARTGRRLYRGI